MAITYKVFGGDGNQYGPVEQEQVQTWIDEGRVTPGSRILRSDQGEWQPADRLAELQFEANPGGGAAPTGEAPATEPDLARLEKAVKSGASWFYWIAGLSLINSAVALTGHKWGFILGLGITQIIDTLARGAGGVGTAAAIVWDVLVAGLFVTFGVFSHRRQAWSFIVGMALYALDGLLFLVGGDWLGLGFHGFALFCIFSGYTALRKLQRSAAQ